jgi:hypothetical protein
MLGRRAGFVWLLATASVGLVNELAAQMPGAPVLQNVWATPGLVAAANLAGGSDGSVYAAAIGWTPTSGRFQLSGGLGARNRTGAGNGAAYGIRLAMPFGKATSSFGLAAFAGIGGSSAGKTPSSSSSSSPDSVANTAEIPVGAAVGWRHSFGATHGISVYATPSFVFYTGGSDASNLLRLAIGADAGLTTRIGITLGAEFGGTRPRGVGGPSGTLYGLGVSYALGKR